MRAVCETHLLCVCFCVQSQVAIQIEERYCKISNGMTPHLSVDHDGGGNRIRPWLKRV